MTIRVLFLLMFSGCAISASLTPIVSSTSPTLDRALTDEAKAFLSKPTVIVDTTLEKTTETSEGSNCQYAWYHDYSLGIIPFRCRETYVLEVRIQDRDTDKTITLPYSFTWMKGFLMYLYPLHPSWEFGHLRSVDELAKKTVINKEVSAEH